MPEDQNWFHKFSTFMDQNIRGIQYGIYSIAGLGLIFALRSVRPFAKFSLPSDIPSHFVQKKMSFIGRVINIEPSCTPGGNPLVQVDHRPLIVLPVVNKISGLPLEVSSVNITNNGFAWLHSLLKNQEVKFIPLRTGPDRVYSILYSKKQNVGQQLVKIGFATVAPIDLTLHKDQYYLKYYKALLSAEKKAEMKRIGVWSDGKVSFVSALLNKLRSRLPFSS